MKRIFGGAFLLLVLLAATWLGWQGGKKTTYEPSEQKERSPYVRSEMVDADRRFKIITYFPVYLKDGVQDWSVHIFQNTSRENLDVRSLYLGFALENKRDGSSEITSVAPFTPLHLVLAPGECRVWRMSWFLNSGLSKESVDQLVGEQNHFPVGHGDFYQLQFICDYWTPAVTNEQPIKMSSAPFVCVMDKKAAYFFNDVAFMAK